MGDSSISSDSAGDRSISPSRSEDTPAIANVTSPSPTPPSPILVSKKLAEEAVAKRNSRLLSQMPKQEPAVSVTPSPRTKPSKKRPAPPPPSATNGHQVKTTVLESRRQLGIHMLRFLDRRARTRRLPAADQCRTNKTEPISTENPIRVAKRNAVILHDCKYHCICSILTDTIGMGCWNRPLACFAIDLRQMIPNWSFPAVPQWARLDHNRRPT